MLFKFIFIIEPVVKKKNGHRIKDAYFVTPVLCSHCKYFLFTLILYQFNIFLNYNDFIKFTLLVIYTVNYMVINNMLFVL